MDAPLSLGHEEFEVAPGQRFLGLDLAQAPPLADSRWLPGLASALREHKALLLRNTGCRSTEDFQALLAVLCPDRMSYSYASTPRSSVGEQVYTSTEYPPSQSIPMHNELAYAKRWPRTLWFFCETPAQAGGATPIADSHKVYQSLDPALVRRFAERGVKYVRNYNTGVDLTWQRAFGVETPAQAEAACQAQGLSFAWTGGDQLRTWQVCPALQRDPHSGETLWFNQAHLFHPSGLEPAVREALQAVFEPDELPRTALYGDGQPIEDSLLEEVRAAFAAHRVPIQWQAGDLALLDNRCVAHGRDPFTGPRRILVAMQGEECSESSP